MVGIRKILLSLKNWKMRQSTAKQEKEPEWHKKYQILEKRITTHKTNLIKLKSEIQEIERKLRENKSDFFFKNA
ncbi:MAG: hypothetical protein ACTSR8_19070 [Promethearchaeota archaeon]